jgi:hypothetical protein
VPLFVSRRRLAEVKKPPRARTTWALDSGGFTELNLHGKWTLSAKQYAAEVKRWQRDIGNLAWAAVMDWMCEPFVLAKTGLTIAEHQRRTTDSFRELLQLEPGLPWATVLQGQREGDYLRHLEQYDRAGFDLRKQPIVGLGSVCRRQGTAEAERIIGTLTRLGLKVHGFGFKTFGLQNTWGVLTSADSMAWSLHARKRPALPGHKHKACNNCQVYALQWRDRLLARCAAHAQHRARMGVQMELPLVA